MVEVHTILRPAPGAEQSPGPWTSDDDGTIRAADGSVVCVLGAPFEGLAEQNITDGAAILAVPELLEALEPFARIASIIRPDLPDSTVLQIRLGEHVIHHLALGSLRAARAAIAKTEGR